MHARVAVLLSLHYSRMKTPDLTKMFSQRGMSPLGLLFLVIVIILILLILDQAYILEQRCQNQDLFECALGIVSPSDQKEQPQGTVTATGTASGEFGGQQHSVTFTMNIPLEGGAVSGSFSGDCDGSIKGSFSGGNGGAISGTGKGSCAWVFPASGSFSGSVNTTSKTVPVSGTGSAAGQSGSGSLTLTY